MKRMSDWTDLVDRLPFLEWQRHARKGMGLADRSYDIEPDHYYALVKDAEQTAHSAMKELEAWHKERETLNE